jgi:hypothetical protein
MSIIIFIFIFSRQSFLLVFAANICVNDVKDPAPFDWKPDPKPSSAVGSSSSSSASSSAIVPRTTAKTNDKSSEDERVSIKFTNTTSTTTKSTTSTLSITSKSTTRVSAFADDWNKEYVVKRDLQLSSSPKTQEVINSQDGEDEQLRRALAESRAMQQPTEEEQLEAAIQESLREEERRKREDEIMQRRVSSRTLYHLESVVSHWGATATSGHYVTDVYDPVRKRWKLYNDSVVSDRSESSVLTNTDDCYMLFYVHDHCWYHEETK